MYSFWDFMTFHSSNLWILEGQVCSVYGWGLFTQNAAKGTHRFTVQEVVLKNPSCCKVFHPTRIDTKDPRYKYIMCAGSLSSLKFWKRWEFSFCPVKFVVFEKATKFDKISILLLTNKYIFLCFPPNFEFSVSYSSSLCGVLWDPSENYLFFKSGKVDFFRNEQKRQKKVVSI